jgi:molybdopterin synthase catalytic subunit
MHIEVLFFAKSKEVVGKASQDLELPEGTDTLALQQQLVAKFPGLESVLRTCVLAVNLEYLGQGESVQLKAGDEVAIIPPLSGG